MTALPVTTPRTVGDIYAALERTNRTELHPRLSASQLGGECERQIWDSFRWLFPPEHHDGRKLSIFRTGEVWEERIVGMLRDAGMEVDDLDVAILSRDLKRQAPEEIAVVTWAARRHVKQGSPDSLRVTYSAGLMSYPEWVCLEHSGPMRFRAEQWWKRHGGAMPAPACVGDALERWAELSPPTHVQVRKNGKWFDLVGRRFAETHQEQAA